MRMSLGIRNNNPFNIRYNKFTNWRGQIGENKGFCVFDSMDYGIRAGIITLRTYIRKHGLTSVKAIISRFAPESENNTRSYISYVSSQLLSFGYSSDNIEFGSPSFCRMCCAMLMMESWYSCSESEIYSIIKQFNLK